MTAHNLKSAYRHCERLARSHYENFPVASWLLPRRLRRPVAVIYAFARSADDFADEGHYSSAHRLALLNGYSAKLQQLEHGEVADDPLFIALADVITRHQLPLSLFYDLLSAFAQDVTKKRYADFDEVLDYCRRSANPVGRLLLHLSGNASEENLQLSDKICSALQLINFYQDLLQDFEENERIYLPEEEMRRYGVGCEHFAVRSNEREMVALFRLQIERARQMMEQGRPLGRRLKGRFGLEIRLIIEGGLAMIERLEQCAEAPFSRPRLRKRDWLRAIWRAL
ncbi:MAG: squalene synthase HpnC [Gammaproteobacteria bacterium]|nr:squalene synthase HpnC [Gammaproteobacteria bacterium]